MFVVKLFKLDPSSFEIIGCSIKMFETLDECKKFIVKKHWEIDYDNCNTDLWLDDFLEENTFESIQDKLYDTFEYEIEEHSV